MFILHILENRKSKSQAFQSDATVPKTLMIKEDAQFVPRWSVMVLWLSDKGKN